MATARYALENPIENKVASIAKAMGVPSLKMNLRGNRGWPDRLFLIPGGRPLFIEMKRPGDDLRPLQEHRRETLQNLGYDVEVHDDVKPAVQAIKDAIRKAKGL
jgi:hypothetical protein